jgi:hypothetical protein
VLENRQRQPEGDQDEQECQAFKGKGKYVFHGQFMR